MKRAIFLWALCAFATVFANFKEDLNNLREKSMKQLNGIVRKLELDFKTAVDDARYGGVNKDVLGCWGELRKLEEYHKSRWSIYASCYTIAFRIYYKEKKLFKEQVFKEAFQYAEECYAGSIALLQKEEKKCRSEAKKCIGNHVIALFGPGNGYIHERL